MQTYSLVLIKLQNTVFQKPCKMCLLSVKTALSVLMAIKTSLAGGLTDYLQDNCETNQQHKVFNIYLQHDKNILHLQLCFVSVH